MLLKPIVDFKISDFNLPKLDIPNQTDWATSAASSFFDSIMGKFMGWFTNIGDKFVIVVNDMSFDVLLLIGLVALILSVFGYEKGKKIALMCPAIYVILQIVLELIFGV